MLFTKLIAAVIEAPARTRREARVRALLEQGATLAGAGDTSEAEKRYSEALTLEPAAGSAHAQLALLYTGLDRMREALPHFRVAHAAGALPPHALPSFVRVLLAHDGCEEALRVAQDALRAGGSAPAWFCLGLVHAAGHRYSEALPCYERACELAPDADAYAHRGITLQYLGRLTQAHEQYERALALDPHHALARFHMSLARLARGDYAAAWPGYELRLASADLPVRPRRYPRWDGAHAPGRTILVYGEQGLGDEIMFASCIPDLLRDGARCVVECDERLRALFKRSFPGAVVYGATPDRRVPDAIDRLEIDAEIPIGSLPLYYRGAAMPFPAHRGYLRADENRVAVWRKRLEALGAGIKVGISWSGGTYASRRHFRSIPLEQWLPILTTPGARFVSLQYGAEADALENLRARHGVEVVRWADALADYDETAALVSALDLTISVCTSVVHLAGALGKPVSVMAPCVPEWRYGTSGERLDWYPSARVHRQQVEGEWTAVVEDAARALRSIVANPNGSTEKASLDAAQIANNAGMTSLASRDFAAAQRSFERAVALAPELLEARVNLAIALIEQDGAAEGERYLREVIARDPCFVPARENLAVLLTSRFDHEAAVEAWDAVLALDPDHAAAHAAQGYLALREGRFDAARRSHRRALELGADRVSIVIQEASMLAAEGDAAGAERLIESLRGTADDADLDWELAMCALARGEFAEGWPRYEARLARRSESVRRAYPFPEWNGEPVSDGALLVMAEQGIGDELMFASCYGDAIARAGTCVIECEPRLERLFARSFPAATIVAQQRPGLHQALAGSGAIRRQIHAGSLPKFFRRSATAFPRHPGYLQADADRVNVWRERLRMAGRRRLIGIAWSGGLHHTGRAQRSIAPAAFAELLRDIADADFVSLQHDDDGSVAEQLAERAGKTVHAFPAALADFDEMAALMCALDGVLSVCSSVVHLAGALGVRALVLTPKRAEWRYQMHARSMPWYPSVRLLRQDESGDWAPVFRQAHALLAREDGFSFP